MEPYVIKLAELGMNDVERVGGKNASLGEMISNLNGLGVTVPGGFATTAAAYRDFLAAEIPILTPVLFFIGVLVLGLFYEMKKGALEWD